MAREFVHRYFEFRRLDGGEALDAVFRLRYQVFCGELGFAAPDGVAPGTERDDFDDRALHFGAFDLKGELAGAVRLVPYGDLGLPLMSHCLVDPPYRPQQGAAEISRLAIDPGYRRRRGDGLYALAARDQDDPQGRERRAKVPEIVLGLYKSLYQASKRLGVEWWYAAMERTLARQLIRFSVRFDPIGPEVDYHGPVRPYRAAIADMESSVLAADPELFETMTEGLERRRFAGVAAE